MIYKRLTVHDLAVITVALLMVKVISVLDVDAPFSIYTEMTPNCVLWLILMDDCAHMNNVCVKRVMGIGKPALTNAIDAVMCQIWYDLINFLTTSFFKTCIFYFDNFKT